MPEYQINPKTNGSRVVCCIPQHGRCPVRCSDCFFQPNKATGESRAYLGKHYEYTPNIPTPELYNGKIVRINDCNDSNHERETVMAVAAQFVDKFFNTSIVKDLTGFVYPVVLTSNPGSEKQTDTRFHKLSNIPINLMSVRVRVNPWNLPLVDQVVDYYTNHNVPVVLTFMAYYETPIPEKYQDLYTYRNRTLNTYWVSNQEVWDMVLDRYKGNDLVLTCGINADKFSCTECRNCENIYRTKIEHLGLPTEVDWT